MSRWTPAHRRIWNPGVSVLRDLARTREFYPCSFSAALHWLNNGGPQTVPQCYPALSVPAREHLTLPRRKSMEDESRRGPRGSRPDRWKKEWGCSSYKRNAKGSDESATTHAACSSSRASASSRNLIGPDAASARIRSTICSSAYISSFASMSASAFSPRSTS